MILHEAEFLSTCEPMEPDKLCTSRIQWWNRRRVDISILKGPVRKWSRVPSKSKSQQGKFCQISRQENKSLWLYLLSFGPYKVVAMPSIDPIIKQKWVCSKDTLDRFYACSLECLTFYQRNATEKLEAVVWNGWCQFFPDVCQRGKQMIDFTFLLKFITVEIYQSDLGGEKDAPSL